MLGFIICALVGLLVVGLGFWCFRAKKPVGFWANAEAPEAKNINDVTGYNRAVGILLIIFGIVFVLLCLPILGGQNSPGIIVSILGMMFESIAAMVVYTVVIEPKYTKK
ncbi:MAG: hypothetical protein IJ282_11270 [Lachnospiraceae bacterium]|nr:hypothetical protein [Lachnospiraceae bacterium]